MTSCKHALGARYYDPRLARFVSADPAVPIKVSRSRIAVSTRSLASGNDFTNSQAINRYAYVFNNPYKYVDPSGQFAITAAVVGLWAVAEVALSAYDAYDTAKTVFSEEISLGEKGIAVGLFGLGIVGPGGGYSQLDNVGETTKRVMSSRAARREAMRKEGIPTSQQPRSQSSPKGRRNTRVGRELVYDTPKGEKRVQHQLTDENHSPHWEAGSPKRGGQTDKAGRSRLSNDKSKVDEFVDKEDSTD